MRRRQALRIGTAALAAAGGLAGWMIETGLRSDLLFWAALRLSEDRLTAALLATDPARVAAASAAQRARVRAILHGILPVSLRYRGLSNDARWAADPPDLPLSGIGAPTLAISAEDDRFGTAAAARHIAATVPGAEALILPDGGHVRVGHDDAVMGAADAFLRRHPWA
jgi:pimeloyl-ACP methyl ester carboxylesterase